MLIFKGTEVNQRGDNHGKQLQQSFSIAFGYLGPLQPRWDGRRSISAGRSTVKHMVSCTAVEFHILDRCCPQLDRPGRFCCSFSLANPTICYSENIKLTLLLRRQALPGSANYQQITSIIAGSGVDNAISHAAEVAASFERSNWATGSVYSGPFYTLPGNASSAVPGDVLKVQQYVNASAYTLAPNIAVSRFLY